MKFIFIDSKSKNVQKNRGFSLLEMVLALAILVVLMVATVHVVKNEREYNQVLANEHYLSNVKDAFMTFVKTNGFLPCPDTNGNGQENRETGPDFECTFEAGRVPFLDLGVTSEDVWHQPLFYAINTRADSGTTLDINNSLASASYFNNQALPNPTFESETLPIGVNRAGAGNYRVCGEQTLPTVLNCNGAATTLIENAAIAVVVSFGQNGAATWIEYNGGANAGLDNAEAENMDEDQNFWLASGSQREEQVFDDQMFWITGWDVKYAIISSSGELDFAIR